MLFFFASSRNAPGSLSSRCLQAYENEWSAVSNDVDAESQHKLKNLRILYKSAATLFPASGRTEVVPDEEQELPHSSPSLWLLLREEELSEYWIRAGPSCRQFPLLQATDKLGRDAGSTELLCASHTFPPLISP